MKWEDVSERTPTPVGWSDTDWIKHIADRRKHEQEKPHPMSCLHINQGSLDAAADAYEAEYNKAHGVEELTVKRTRGSEPRTRRPSEEEVERILFCLGYSRDEAPETKTARVGAAYRFAIQTAMRAGEIAGLEWRDVEMARRYLRTRGKTPAATREVPLSSEALEVLDQMAGVRDGASVFGISTASLDALFRKARAKAGVEDLTFHDSRHEAITRLAKVFDVLELARIVGHRDLRMLLIYYNPSAEDLSGKLK
jgi:integrase